MHQRADLRVSRGVIPVGFYSYMLLDEGQPMYLETRPLIQDIQDIQDPDWQNGHFRAIQIEVGEIGPSWLVVSVVSVLEKVE